MKKSLAKKITLSILAGAVLMSSSVVWADALSGWKVSEEVSSIYIPETGAEGTISDGSTYSVDISGVAEDNNDASVGKVTISGGTFGSGHVYGGYSTKGLVKENDVEISGGTFGTNGNVYVYGGYTEDGDAEGNTVEISNVDAVSTFENVYGGDSYSGAVNNNKVTLSAANAKYNDSVYGGNTETGNANYNTVNISNGTYEDALVYGGCSTSGSASFNTVNISNGTFEGASVYGGNTETGNATYNAVTISGGTFAGGDSLLFVCGGYSDAGSASENIVNISNGTFGYVVGGFSEEGNATKNTVNISGTADLGNANLYGGATFESPSVVVGCYGGNILNIGIDDALKNTLDPEGKYGLQVGAWQNNSVKSIAGFDVINFNYINWSHEGNVVETDTLALDDEEGTIVGKVVIGDGTVKNGEWMNLISSTNSVTGNFKKQTNWDITIRTGLTTSETVTGDIELIDNNLKLTITTDTSDGVSGGTGSGDGGSGTSSSTNVPAGATSFVDAIDKVGEETVAYKVLDAVYTNYTTDEEQKKAVTNMLQLGEAGGQSATAANISRNVSGASVNRMSFGGRGGVRHRGGHGPADFNKKDGSAVWAQYVYGKDKVDGMALADGVTTSYESQFNGVVLGVDFKEVGKYQSGIAFNYGEGDSHTKNFAFSRSDYDFWGIGYYGAVKNADSNVIFDINYAKTDSEVKQQFRGGVELEAEPETTTISAGVKVEKLIDKGAMQFVPYAGLRFMSIDTDEYSANYLGKEAFNYSADRQNIWLLPVGVSFRQENVYDSGWVVTPKVDLSYIWAFGDTENEMTVRTPDVTEAARLGYTVMNDGSFLGSIGLEAEKGDWTFGVAYSYQKSSDSRSDRWYVDAKYSF